jgi:hypothetical protein
MRRLALFLVLPALGSGCIEFSPFETDLADDERAQNRKNLAELAALSESGDSFRFAVHRGFARFVCFNSNSLEFDSVPDLTWLAEQTD